MLLTQEAQEVLKNYAWPRNTREIQDLLENWVVNGYRLITPEQIPMRIRANLPREKKMFTQYQLDLIEEMGLKEFLDSFKNEIILEFIKRNNDSSRQAAKKMRIAPSTISHFFNGRKS